PKYAFAYANRGFAKKDKGDLDGAIADYKRATDVSPKNAFAYDYSGLARKDKGDLDGAIADYNRALELDPKYAHAYNGRCVAYYVKRDWPAALTDFRRYCELSGPRAHGDQDYRHLFIWLIRARLGETDAADKELAAYLDKRANADPNDWVSRVAG